jgi:uncharacterized protein YndB with AHSA1/START domain
MKRVIELLMVFDFFKTPVWLKYLALSNPKMNPPIERSIAIQASPQTVWPHLTEPGLMIQWMGDPELKIEIMTDWVVGHPLLIKGFHHIKFENKGRVLQFEPYRLIQYSHLSSVSRLPDVPASYSLFTFLLTPTNNETLLTVRIENFPTETIYKHLEFYWGGTLAVIKNSIESGRA